MKLSVKSDYATRAVLSLARRFLRDEIARVDELARENGVPANYLVQILIELKSQQIVKSQRGKDGGYRLARPPAEITLGDVLKCIHGPLLDSPALTDPKCPAELKDAWRRLQASCDFQAAQITFQSLLEKGAERMFYI